MRLSGRIFAALTVSLVLTIAAACGGGGDGYTTGTGQNPGDTTSTSSQITVADNSYSPKTTTVAIGTAVTWTWNGTSQHSVTFADGVSSPTQNAGTYQRTFTTAGTYNYQCLVHGSIMSGTVTVK